MSKSNEWPDWFEDKVKGALYGFAIGDAMGATTEFMSANQIKAVYGQVTDIIGGGWLHLDAGDVTDDTQMSLCVMNAIMLSKGQEGAFTRLCRQGFIDWYKSNPPDVGNQCAKGITAMMCGQKLGIDNNALGNGSLMRALPCALMNDYGLNIVQSRMTHWSDMVEQCIKVYHDTIFGLTFYQDYRCMKYSNELMEPTGHVPNTLNNALYWANRDSFEEGMLGAVNHGGDSDTIGAISGSILGARYGFSSIPEKWKFGVNMDVRDALEIFCQFIIKVWQPMLDGNYFKWSQNN